MPLPETPRVFKADLSSEPVQIRYKDQMETESQSLADAIILEAQKAADRIRRAAITAAEKERSQAQEEAARIRQQAQSEKETLIQQTRETTREETRQAVMNDLKPRIIQAAETLERILYAAEQIFGDVFEAHKNELVELALSVSERVIRKISNEDRELVCRTAQAALAAARERQKVDIYVNPDDFEIMKEFEIELISRFDDLKILNIEMDRRVDRGGIQIETASGFIDARIKTQLDEIIKNVAFDLRPDSNEPIAEP